MQRNQLVQQMIHAQNTTTSMSALIYVIQKRNPLLIQLIVLARKALPHVVKSGQSHLQYGFLVGIQN